MLPADPGSWFLSVPVWRPALNVGVCVVAWLLPHTLPQGWEQAKDCGQKIRELIESDGEDDWKVYFYVSPYLRTIQVSSCLSLALPLLRNCFPLDCILLY